jgi:hypothetical protein
MCNPNTTCQTHTTEVVTITKDATSPLKSWGKKCSEAPCTTLTSQSTSERRASSSSTTVKLTPASGWRTTALLAGQAGQMMTFLAYSSSPFTWLTPPGPSWIIC